MAQEDPNRIAEWYVILRGKLPILRQQFDDWLEAVREEPYLIWETRAVRYGTYGLSAFILILGVKFAFGMFVPPPPENAKPEATTADYHVICTAPECGHHFVIRREFGFRRFPVECPKCQRETGAQARRCNSSTCRGRWIVPRQVDGVVSCPICGTRFDE